MSQIKTTTSADQQLISRWAPIYGTWKAGPITFRFPFYACLLEGTEKGCLPHDQAAHALWEYYILARRAYEKFKSDLVYEGERDPTPPLAKQLFTSIAKKHNVTVYNMSKYWTVIERQRFLLGLSSNVDLPTEYKVRFM